MKTTLQKYAFFCIQVTFHHIILQKNRNRFISLGNSTYQQYYIDECRKTFFGYGKLLCEKKGVILHAFWITAERPRTNLYIFPPFIKNVNRVVKEKIRTSQSFNAMKQIRPVKTSTASI